jgi:hypothetical protein
MISHLLNQHKVIPEVPTDHPPTNWEAALDWLPPILLFLASGFITTFVGATAGACAGAVAATKIAERSRRESLRIQDLRMNNSAVVLSAAIAIQSLRYKKKLTKDMIAQYLQDRTTYKNYLKDLSNGKIVSPVKLIYDFFILPLLNNETDELKKLLVNEISPEVKTIKKVLQLCGSLHSLERCIEQRTAEIERLEALRGNLSDDLCASKYFVIPDKFGNIDERYFSTMNSIKLQLDSSIYFPVCVVEELSERGMEIARQIGKEKQSATTWSFSGPEFKGLIPDKSEFPD